MWRTGLVAPRHLGSSWARARTRVPCIGRWILNHCATREVPYHPFLPWSGRLACPAPLPLPPSLSMCYLHVLPPSPWSLHASHTGASSLVLHRPSSSLPPLLPHLTAVPPHCCPTSSQSCLPLIPPDSAQMPSRPASSDPLPGTLPLFTL